MKRPIGISVVGWGLLILQLPILLYGLSALLAYDFMVAIVSGLTAFLGGALSVGMLKGKNWARLLFLGLSTLYMVWDILDFIRAKEYLNKVSLLTSCTIYFLVLAVCIYLLSPSALQYFKNEKL